MQWRNRNSSITRFRIENESPSPVHSLDEKFGIFGGPDASEFKQGQSSTIFSRKGLPSEIDFDDYANLEETILDPTDTDWEDDTEYKVINHRRMAEDKPFFDLLTWFQLKSKRTLDEVNLRFKFNHYEEQLPFSLNLPITEANRVELWDEPVLPYDLSDRPNIRSITMIKY